MNAFSKIFGLGDKNLQDRANDLTLQLAKSLQVASAKMHECVQNWSSGAPDRVRGLAEEVTRIERHADAMTDELVQSIFSKHAYLPQQTEERYQLVRHMDRVVDAAEKAVRTIATVVPRTPPQELLTISEKCWTCTDLLQDAVKYVFIDFEKAVELCVRIESVREEARDVEFALLERLYNTDEIPARDIIILREVSECILDVAITSEETADFIRALAVRYS
jgi:predicted phosphate transport protein (TIGR00153 family)